MTLTAPRSLFKRDSLSNFWIDQASLLKILNRYNCEPCIFDLLFGFRAIDEVSEKGYGLWTARYMSPTNFSLFPLVFSLFQN